MNYLFLVLPIFTFTILATMGKREVENMTKKVRMLFVWAGYEDWTAIKQKAEISFWEIRTYHIQQRMV